MFLPFKIYKHNRTISLLVVIVVAVSAIIAQSIYFQSIMSDLNSKSNDSVSHYNFSELANIKKQKKVEVKKDKPKPKVKKSQVPDSVMNIGNNIKFIGFIKSDVKVFILVQYGGMEYNLEQGEKIKTKGGSDTIIFETIEDNYALFKINKYTYRMSVEEKYPEIPLMAE